MYLELSGELHCEKGFLAITNITTHITFILLQTLHFIYYCLIFVVFICGVHYTRKKLATSGYFYHSD